MLDTFIISFTTFFATIGPLDVAAMFAVLTGSAPAKFKRSMAVKGTLIAAIVLFIFALFGDILLNRLGITLAALRTAGGILLLLIGINMVFARSTGGTGTTGEEEQEAIQKTDIAVFPLATPLIAGPGAMGAAILLMANAQGDHKLQAAVLLGLAAILVATFICLLLATQVQRVLGVTGLQVISRVFGVLLTALAVQFIFDGIVESSLFTQLTTENTL